MESVGKKKSIAEMIKRTVEEELKDDIAFDDVITSIVLVVVSVLMLLYFVAHQMWSTGFFTASFDTLEMLLLYGIFIFWIATSALILLGYKIPSRDLDSFGRLLFNALVAIF